MDQKSQILLYVPNLIGYVRIVSALIICLTARTDPVITAWAYSISQFGDLFDGIAARQLNQSSVFGAVLDMVTDRFSNACILAILYQLYGDLGFIFLWVMALDYTSHWYQMYSTLYCNEKHHKTAVNKYRLLEIYYKTPYVLFIMVLTSETAMVTLYLHKFNSEFSSYVQIAVTSLLYLTFPFFVLKHILNAIQLFSAAEKIIEKEIEQKKN